jgi:hypothetical protein
MVDTAPIEVWEKILKYAISVPIFFDLDPIKNYGLECAALYRSEADYWQSERDRNAFRRVCRSWDMFLQRYEHRYVRLSDIYNGRIPMKAAQMAIRFNIDPDLNEEADIQGLFSRMSRLLRSLITPPGPYVKTASVSQWKMEILEGLTVMDTTLYANWIENSPRLRAVLDPIPKYLPQIEPKAPGVQFLYKGPLGRRF